jgi:tetratricopeptide (TPR) repeat protein/uncharacterized RDD family membrane protein YckC
MLDHVKKLFNTKSVEIVTAKDDSACLPAAMPPTAEALAQRFEQRPAGFFRRAASLIVDDIVLSLVPSLPANILVVGTIILDRLCPGHALSFSQLEKSLLSAPCFFWMLLLLGPLVLWVIACILYFAIFESSALQATPGKRLVRLQVIAADGKRVSFLACLWKSLLQGLLLFACVGLTLLVGAQRMSIEVCSIIGYAFYAIITYGWMPFNQGRQTLFDLLTKRFVVFVPPPSVTAPQTAQSVLPRLHRSEILLTILCTLSMAMMGLTWYLNINRETMAVANFRIDESRLIANRTGTVLIARRQLTPGEIVHAADFRSIALGRLRTPTWSMPPSEMTDNGLVMEPIADGQMILEGNIRPHAIALNTVIDNRQLPHERILQLRLERDSRYIASWKRPASHSADVVDQLQAHSLTEDMWSALKDRGDLYVELGQFQAALADFDQAIKLGDEGARVYRVKALVGMGQLQEALTELNSIAESEQDERFFTVRQSVYEHLGNTKLAQADKEQVEQFVKRRVADSLTVESHRELYKKQYKDAAATCSKAIALANDCWEAHYLRAEAYIGDDHPELAVADLDFLEKNAKDDLDPDRLRVLRDAAQRAIRYRHPQSPAGISRRSGPLN